MVAIRNSCLLACLLLFMQWAAAVHAANHAGEVDAPVEICAVCATVAHHAAPPPAAQPQLCIDHSPVQAPQLFQHDAEAPAHSAYLSRAPPALI